MGTTCGNCTCGKSEAFSEFVLQDGPENIEKAERPEKSSTNNSDIEFETRKHTKKTVKRATLSEFAVKIQALWRGYKTRKLIEYFLSNQASSRYFTHEESRETLTRVYNPKATREVRPPYRFKSGAVYRGEWRGGFRDGKGDQTWPDGAKYAGDWKDNKAHGQGIFWHVDGDTYEGHWVNGKANGYGKYVHKNGACYEGEWRDDLQHGKGKEIWADGSRYEGDYWGGKKQGFGRYEWADGSRYEGAWLNNEISGEGTYTWLDGRKYVGAWENNNMHGQGIYTWADGRIYRGEYRNDKKDGYGIYCWADGRIYEGWWSKGKQFGFGKYFSGKEVRYGLWENGRRNKWFTREEVAKIEQGDMKYKECLKDASSIEMVDTKTRFTPPPYFKFRSALLK